MALSGGISARFILKSCVKCFNTLTKSCYITFINSRNLRTLSHSKYISASCTDKMSQLNRLNYKIINSSFDFIGKSLNCRVTFNSTTQVHVCVQRFHTSNRQCFKSLTNDAKINPVLGLQEYMSVPIIPENYAVFNPTMEEILEGNNLFVASEFHKIKWSKSVVDLERLPDYDIPEVCFVGRSNVGKSSLIRTMFTEAPEVQEKVSVSKQPGHTKTLRFYQVGMKFTCVDMPGYGYRMPSHYAQSVEAYLKTRKKLVRSFVLIDANSGITAADRIGLDMMEEFVIPLKMAFILIDGELGIKSNDKIQFEKFKVDNIPHALVITKIDKTKPHKLLKNLVSILEYRDQHTKFCLPQPFLVSVVTGDGIALLQTFIAYLTGNIKISGL